MDGEEEVAQEGKGTVKRRGSGVGDAEAAKAKKTKEQEEGNGYTPAKA